MSTKLHKGFSAEIHPCQNSQKNNDSIPRKCPERRKDRQTLFHGTLSATIGGPTSTTAVDWHLKVR